ncbi:MAG: hypothetical protein JSS66_07385 [Armatimonadetes bacterium]|nr:hypothetical protein [Armatimonadota bacterium]
MTQNLVQNPYLDAYKAVCTPALSAISAVSPVIGDVLLTVNTWQTRDRCLEQYGFAVPSQEAIELLATLSPLVEMGAGLGYWASLVEALGADIVAYDKYVNKRGKVKLYSSTKYGKPFLPVHKGTTEVLELHADRTLFMCWPPYDSPMASDTLQAYLDHGGQTVVHVGEGPGGCTGDDRFFGLLEEHMEETQTLDIPRWPGIRDYLSVWRRL